MQLGVRPENSEDWAQPEERWREGQYFAWGPQANPEPEYSEQHKIDDWGPDLSAYCWDGQDGSCVDLPQEQCTPC